MTDDEKKTVLHVDTMTIYQVRQLKNKIYIVSLQYTMCGHLKLYMRNADEHQKCVEMLECT